MIEVMFEKVFFIGFIIILVILKKRFWNKVDEN